MINLKKYIKPQKFIWIDLEMTGLDPVNCKITEVGVIITDVNFNELETYEAVVHQPAKVLESADKWVKDNMQTVLKESAKAKKNDAQVEKEVLALLEKHFDEHAVLAGNSIHQDRRFIRQWWPNLEEKLHYRMLDVSAWKVYMIAKYDVEFKKPNEHRALSDIRGSIEELKSYLNFFEDKA